MADNTSDGVVVPPGGNMETVANKTDGVVVPPGGNMETVADKTDGVVVPPGGNIETVANKTDEVVPPGDDQTDGGDEVDAKRIRSLFACVGGNPTSGLPTKRTKLSENFPTYNMNHHKRGIFVIINNKTFDKRTQMDPRPGTDEDRDALFTTTAKLGFEVHVFEDATCQAMLEIMENAAKADHRDSDCFGCAILSHGDDGVVFGKDGILEIKSLVAPFAGDKCPQLAGKPKLFIIQACRGNQLDFGVTASDGGIECDGASKRADEQRIPVEADFLYAYSTPPGYYSWRRQTTGSWFVQELCKVFQEWGQEKEVLWMLTKTNYMVAYHYESSSNKPFLKRKKAVPSIVSQLTKELYFHPKS